MSEAPQRHWFQFSLRSLLVGVALLAVFLTWLAVQVDWIRQRRAAIASGIAVPHRFSTPHIVPNPPFGFRLLGEEGQRHLFVSASQFGRVCQLFPESEVIEYPVTNTSRHRPLNEGGSKRTSSAPLSVSAPAPKQSP